MDWRTVAFDWNHVRAFLLTVEEGSLSAAARASGLAQPTLGRQVDGLQRALGVVLFERDGRGLRPTPSALALIEPARAMLDAARQIERAASGRVDVDGVVRVSASETYACFLLPTVIQRLRAEHPGIRVEIVATSRISDLRRREADVALRNAAPADPELIARKLRSATAFLYGAPALLDRLGRPQTPDALASAPFVGFEDSATMAAHTRAAGVPVTEASFVVACENHVVQWELVRQGVGLGWMDARIGDADPRVERALPAGPAIPFPMWLVAHRELARSRRIRIVFDAIASAVDGLPRGEAGEGTVGPG